MKNKPTSKKSKKPAIDLISDQIKHEKHLVGHHLPEKPLLIGIDGNEANIKNRVGSNMVAFKLLHALKALNEEIPKKHRHRFLVYLKNEPLPDFPPETTSWKYCVIPFKKLWTQFRLPYELYFGHDRPDIFFSPGHYVPRFAPMPIVNTIMDTAYLDFPEYFKKQDLMQLKTWTEQAEKKVVHTIAISQSTKNDVIKHYHKQDDQVTVAPLGIDHQHFFFPQLDKEINRVKKKYHINNDYLLYVGTLQPRKNLLRLIEAFKKVKLKREGRKSNDETLTYEGLTLVIVGKKGWLYEEIYAKVKNLGLEDSVIFTGYAPDEDLPGLMAGARALALVALYEGFGIPVVESLAVGTPAIVSKISSLPEVLGNAGYGINPNNVDDIADKLGRMLDLNSKDYYQLSEKGIKHANLFRWEHTARIVLKVLEHNAGLPT